MKKMTLSLLLLLVALISYAQNNKSNFSEKKNQHNISAEFASISYTYMHQFAPKLRLGARIQIGYDLYYSPIMPPETQAIMLDLINFQLLYRTPVAKSFYFDMGILATYISFLGSFDSQQVNTFGIVGSAYYHYRKLHVGFSLQLRGFNHWYYDSFTPSGEPLTSSRKFSSSIVFSPLIIGVNF
jgi:hypothetical protein